MQYGFMPGGEVRGNDQVLLHTRVTKACCRIVQNISLKFGVEEDNEEKIFNDDDDMGSKWWCKVGHSRRGLEHIVPVNEVRQRQKLVNASVSTVLEEQRRQHILIRDSKKIASISMQYTAWAKALASTAGEAGEADEEAVKSKFCAKAQCRLSYLSKSVSRRPTANETETKGKPCASFVLMANSALKQ